MKIWLAQVLQNIQADQLCFECEAKSLGDDRTLGELESEFPTIRVSFNEDAVYSSTELHDQFDSNLFSDYTDFVNDESNGSQVCALHFLLWHRKCFKEKDLTNFPSHRDSYNRCIESIKSVQIAWGNSSPARWLDAALGPFELAKLFCKSFGSRLSHVVSFTDLDAGSLFHMLHKCVFFQRQVQGVTLETSRAVVWARRLWYNSWDSDLGRLSCEDFTRIMLILSELFRQTEKAYQKLCQIVALQNFDFFHLLADDSLDFASFSDDQSGIQTEKYWVCDVSQDGGSSVRSDAPDFDDVGVEDFLRFRIVSPGHAASAKPFAPVVENKKVKFEFTISLKHATVSFDGRQKPLHAFPSWEPRHAIASWASWKRACNGTVKVSSNLQFDCKEAANVTRSGAAASHLQLHWHEDTASVAKITKKLKQKPGEKAFEELFIQITLLAANQCCRANDVAAAHKPPTHICDHNSKRIVLGTPFLINLSVRLLRHVL
jgi:hypothetical protein